MVDFKKEVENALRCFSDAELADFCDYLEKYNPEGLCRSASWWPSVEKFFVFNGVPHENFLCHIFSVARQRLD